MDGGTNDKGSKIFVMCGSEGVRHDSFSSVAGDVGDVDLDVDAEEERVLTGYECLLREMGETRLTGQTLRRGYSAK